MYKPKKQERIVMLVNFMGQLGFQTSLCHLDGDIEIVGENKDGESIIFNFMTKEMALVQMIDGEDYTLLDTIHMYAIEGFCYKYEIHLQLL